MKNIFNEKYHVSPAQRRKLKKHKPLLIWFTGLSGSGKSTLAKNLEVELYKKNYHTFCLDGDNVRMGLNNNTDFSPEGRKENLRRIGEVAKLMIDSGLVVIGAFISPTENDRNMVNTIVGDDHYFEVFVDTPLAVCEERDVKGLYAKARKGEIENFTGISAPYESPVDPDIRIDTSTSSMEEILGQLIEKVEEHLKP
jgi:adenylyl-sulfate kinase